MKKLFRRSPVFFMILLTCVLFGGVSVQGGQSIYRDIPEAAGYEPVCAPMFKGIHEGIYPWSRVDSGLIRFGSGGGFSKTVSAGVRFDDDAAGAAGTVSGCEVPGADRVLGNAASGPDSVSRNAVNGAGSVSGNAANGRDNFLGYGANRTCSLSGNVVNGSGSPGENAAKGPVFQRVEEDYFDDALFIGDSRTVGLFEYGRIEDRAQFYAQTSLMIYEVLENPKAIVKTDDERKLITVEEALSENQFGKIYIMLGLNEMGFGTPEYFGRAYGAVIDRIRELQPDAVIYIQSIMHVADKKNRTDPVYNNANIDLRNQPLKRLADNEHIFYLDVNEVLCDETGCLNSDWTFDQVHLKAAYYQIWKDYLLDHAIVR